MHLINCACRIAALVALASLPLRAQQARGTVTVTGQVSAVATIYAGPAARVVKGEARVVPEAGGAQGLVLSLSGPRGGATQVEIPVQLRSNADFALIASWTTKGTTLSALSVREVRAAGAFVYPGAAGRVVVPTLFDGRAGAPVARGSRLELSSPATLLTGPPISMGGMPNSPDNMIEVVLGVVLTAPDGEESWEAELKLSTVFREPGQDTLPAPAPAIM